MADILSQDELDALLGQMKGDDDDDDEAAGHDPFERVAAEEVPAEVPPTIAEVVEEAPDDEAAALDWAAAAGPDVNVQMILDIPVKVDVELGRARLTIGDLLALGQGAVIELDHLASDLLDLTVNRKVVAQGEAVVINENFGVRVLEVDSVRDRIRKL
ncbi:MAG: flagellar motor switch protein FliN [bacterium]